MVAILPLNLIRGGIAPTGVSPSQPDFFGSRQPQPSRAGGRAAASQGRHRIPSQSRFPTKWTVSRPDAAKTGHLVESPPRTRAGTAVAGGDGQTGRPRSAASRINPLLAGYERPTWACRATNPTSAGYGGRIRPHNQQKLGWAHTTAEVTPHNRSEVGSSGSKPAAAPSRGCGWLRHRGSTASTSTSRPQPGPASRQSGRFLAETPPNGPPCGCRDERAPKVVNADDSAQRFSCA